MMTVRWTLVILAVIVVNVLDLSTAAPLVSGKHDPVGSETNLGGASHLVRRQASTSNDSSLDTTTVIIVCVVIIGGYFLILAAIIGSLIFCFVRCNCENGSCSPKCTRKARIGCPKLLEDNVTACCTATAKHCCPCCSDPNNWDSGELGFWIEIVLLAIFCFPFALCLLVLWAIVSNG